MKRFVCIMAWVGCALSLSAQSYTFPQSEKEDKEQIMSDAYWKIWNPEVQKQIDEQISKYVVHSNNIIITTEVNFGDSGLGYDYAIIDIYINGGKAIGFLIDKE